MPRVSICKQSLTRLRNSSQMKGSGKRAFRFLKSLIKERIFPAGQYSKKSAYRSLGMVSLSPRSAYPRNSPTLENRSICISMFSFALTRFMCCNETDSNRFTTALSWMEFPLESCTHSERVE
ncbi:hypothetical protein GRF29_164g1532153 [Pseudopithomyces chartarum]|uniref:Uncharacterized protein n=1 Tax=Pseudopithomyces chartarum TaxID=1892770 RepID=A0AAN6LPV4_9PLEO|nr:hypothetical protein GRF29_164g1532153 [Pseudopithomyces chartarum]